MVAIIILSKALRQEPLPTAAHGRRYAASSGTSVEGDRLGRCAAGESHRKEPRLAMAWMGSWVFSIFVGDVEQNMEFSDDAVWLNIDHRSTPMIFCNHFWVVLHTSNYSYKYSKRPDLCLHSCNPVWSIAIPFLCLQVDKRPRAQECGGRISFQLQEDSST